MKIFGKTVQITDKVYGIAPVQRIKYAMQSTPVGSGLHSSFYAVGSGFADYAATRYRAGSLYATGSGEAFYTAYAARLGIVSATGYGSATSYAGLSKQTSIYSTGSGFALAAGELYRAGSSAATGTGSATAYSTRTIHLVTSATGTGSASSTLLLTRFAIMAAAGVGSATANTLGEQQGDAFSTGIGTASCTAVRTIFGITSATGTGSATAAATTVEQAATSATGIGTATTAALRTRTAIMAAAGVATATSTETETEKAASQASGVGTATFAALVYSIGAMAASGAGTATAAATRVHYGTTSASGAATASSAATTTEQASTSASGAATASAAATRTIFTSTSASGVGSAVFSSEGTQQGDGYADGVGTATFAATRTAVGATTASGAGTATSAATRTADGAMVASGVGTGTAAAETTELGIMAASGVGTATSAATRAAVGATSASGVGTATTAATRIHYADTSASGIGTATSAATTTEFTVTAASGVGSAASAATRSAVGVTTASGVGTASTSALRTIYSTTSASGVGTATSSATTAEQASISANGVGTATSAATRTAIGAMAASGAGTGTSNGITIEFGTSASTGIATAAASSTATRYASASANAVGTSSATFYTTEFGITSASGIGTATSSATRSHTGATSASGAATASAAAERSRAAITSAAGVGTATAAATLTHVGATAANGAGTATAAATRDKDGVMAASGVGTATSAATQYDTFIITIDTTKAGSANDTFIMPAGDRETYNATIFWGDGQQSKITAYNDADLSHTYSATGVYEVRIAGTFPWINFNNVGDKAKLTSIDQWGDLSMTSMYKSFFGCENLTGLPNAPIQAASYCNLGEMFHGCDSLTTVPSTLLNNFTASTNLLGIFMESQGLTSLPSGLFDNNVGATSFRWICYDCNSLTGVPNGLFDNNVNVDNFDAAFYSCSNLTTVPSGLFQYNTGATVFTSVFSSTALNTTVYSNLLVNLATYHVNTGINFHGGNSYYKGAPAIAARDYLVTGLGWTITDLGLEGEQFGTMNATGVGTAAASGYKTIGAIPFISTWNTTYAGSPSDTIVIPTHSGATYNCTVDWGDGTTGTFTTYNDTGWTHQYASTGIYQVEIKGQFGRIWFNDEGDKAKITSVDQWGEVGWESMNRAFVRCLNLTSLPTGTGISGAGNSFTGVSNFSSMFFLSSNTPRPSDDFFQGNPGNITTVNGCFYNTAFSGAVESGFLDGMTGCTNIQQLFRGTKVNSVGYGLFNDLDSVTDFKSVFLGSDLTGFPTGMFSFLSGRSLASEPFSNMLYQTHIKNLYSGTFHGAPSNASYKRACAYMTGLTGIEVGTFENTSNTNAQNLFEYCSNLKQVPSGILDFSNLRYMENMFIGVDLNTDSYSQLLERMAVNKTQTSVGFHGGTSQYKGIDAINARATLTDTRSWTITDGGIEGEQFGISNSTGAGTASSAATLFDASEAFTFIVDTTKAGTANDTFRVAIDSAGTYNCTVKWGDGNSDTFTGWNDAAWTHQYASTGVYTIQIGGPSGSRTFSKINFNGTSGTDKQKILEITNWGDTAFDTFSTAFQSCSNLTGIPQTSINPGSATSMQSMFRFASIKEVPSGFFDLCSGITDIDNVFEACDMTSLPSGFFTGLTSAGSITSMAYAFSSVPLTTLPENLFNPLTGLVNFVGVFRSTNLTGIPSGTFALNTSINNFNNAFQNVDLDTANYGNLLQNLRDNNTNTSVNFHGGTSQYKGIEAINARATLTDTRSWSITDGGIEGEQFGVMNATGAGTTTSSGYQRDALIMKINTTKSSPNTGFAVHFSGSYADGTIIWGDGNTSPVTGTGVYTHGYASTGIYDVALAGRFDWFRGVSDSIHRQKVTDIVQWGDTDSTSWEYRFGYMNNLTGLPTGAIPNVEEVTKLIYAFRGCSSLVNLPTGMLDNFTQTFGAGWMNQGLFWFCGSIEKIPAGFFDNCTGWKAFAYTFANCTALTGIPSGLFDNVGTSVQDFTAFAATCPNLTDIDPTLFEFSNPTKLDDVFNSADINKVDYSAMLVNLSGNATNTGVVFGAGTSQYAGVSGIRARDFLVTGRNWTITDGGLYQKYATGNATGAGSGYSSGTWIEGGTQFVTTWDTTKYPAFPNTVDIQVPVGTYDVTVLWGDGSSGSYTAGGAWTHTYASTGVYDVTIKGPITGFRGWSLGTASSAVSKSKRLLKVKDWGQFIWDYAPSGFKFCTNLTGFETGSLILDNPASGTGSFSDLFFRCSSMASIPDINFSGTGGYALMGWFEECSGITGFPTGLITSKVTNLASTFYDCATGLTTTFPSQWDFSNVTGLYSTFSFAKVTGYPTGWDLSSVINASNAWTNNLSMTEFPPYDLSSCLNASYAWNDCSGLTTFPSGITLTGCTGFNWAWAECGNLTSFPALDLSAGKNFTIAWYQCGAITGWKCPTFGTGFNNGTLIFDQTTIPERQFSEMLYQLSGNPNTSVTLGAGTNKYNFKGKLGRDYLTGQSWTITDGGMGTAFSYDVDTTKIAGATNTSGFEIGTDNSNPNDWDAYIEWGDGNWSNATGWNDTGALIHDYGQTGRFTIKIWHDFPNQHASSPGADEERKIVDHHTWGSDVGWKDLDTTFDQTYNLTGFPTDGSTGSGQLFNDVTSANGTWWIAFTLAERPPENLFHRFPNISNFSTVFSFTDIPSVPSGIFVTQGSKVTTFYNAFSYCAFLASTGIPENLFSTNTNVTSFRRLFMQSQSTGFRSVPSGLFANNTKVGAGGFRELFYNSRIHSTGIPSNLFSQNTGNTDFYYAFGGNSYTGFTYLPSGLFDQQTEVTTFERLCYSSTNFTGIPSGLFDNNTKATTFRSAFYSCDVRNVPVGLFDNNTGATDFGYLFGNCTNMTGVPSGLFQYCTNANKFDYCFIGVTLGTQNYSDLLNNLADNMTASNVAFHGGNSQYNNSATGARDYLTGTLNWTITDGGLA